MRRSTNIDPGCYQEQDASHQPPRTPQEGVPMKHGFGSADADGTAPCEQAYDEVEASMHEQEGPCAPDEDEQDPAGNPAAPRPDQRERDEPTEHFDDSSD